MLDKKSNLTVNQLDGTETGLLISSLYFLYGGWGTNGFLHRGETTGSEYMENSGGGHKYTYHTLF